jgi:hypothetical protein
MTRRLSIVSTFLALLSFCDARAHAIVATLANDACATPTVISALPFSSDVDTENATVEAGDPTTSTCACTPILGSVWYQFTPAQSGLVSIDTFGSDFDTVIDVWTGTCGALTQATCSDDFGNSTRSRALLQVTSGTTYLIEITDCFGPQGALHLTVDLVPTAADAKDFDKCQAALKKNDAKLFVASLKGTDKCTAGLLKCVELKASDPGCIAKACDGCVKAFQKYQAAHTALASKTEATCAESLVPSAELSSTSGLGFANVTDRCAADFNGAVTDVSSAVACVQTEHTCVFSQLAGAQMPRSHELLGLCSSLPGTFGCIPDHGANGGSLADATLAKSLLKCEAAIQKAASAFVVTNLTTLEKCIDVVFTCVQTKPGDDTCIHTQDSKAKAETTCSKLATKSQTAEAKVKPAIDKACAGVSMSALFDANGANIGALVATCATYGVTLATLDDYVECLSREHECLTEELGRFAAPRADALLDLVGIPLHSAFCP